MYVRIWPACFSGSSRVAPYRRFLISYIIDSGLHHRCMQWITAALLEFRSMAALKAHCARVGPKICARRCCHVTIGRLDLLPTRTWAGGSGGGPTIRDPLRLSLQNGVSHMKVKVFSASSRKRHVRMQCIAQGPGWVLTVVERPVPIGVYSRYTNIYH